MKTVQGVLLKGMERNIMRDRDKFQIICRACGSEECTIATDLTEEGVPFRVYLECNECGSNSSTANEQSAGHRP